jgi:hypothetical protein
LLVLFSCPSLPLPGVYKPRIPPHAQGSSDRRRRKMVTATLSRQSKYDYFLERRVILCGTQEKKDYMQAP